MERVLIMISVSQLKSILEAEDIDDKLEDIEDDIKEVEDDLDEEVVEEEVTA